jgi:hypothetical protein
MVLYENGRSVLDENFNAVEVLEDEKNEIFDRFCRELSKKTSN